MRFLINLVPTRHAWEKWRSPLWDILSSECSTAPAPPFTSLSTLRKCLLPTAGRPATRKPPASLLSFRRGPSAPDNCSHCNAPILRRRPSPSSRVPYVCESGGELSPKTSAARAPVRVGKSRLLIFTTRLPSLSTPPSPHQFSDIGYPQTPLTPLSSFLLIKDPPVAPHFSVSVRYDQAPLQPRPSPAH